MLVEQIPAAINEHILARGSQTDPDNIGCRQSDAVNQFRLLAVGQGAEWWRLGTDQLDAGDKLVQPGLQPLQHLGRRPVQVVAKPPGTASLQDGQHQIGTVDASAHVLEAGSAAEPDQWGAIRQVQVASVEDRGERRIIQRH